MSFESLSAPQIILCMVITVIVTIVITSIIMFSIIGITKLVANATIDRDRHPDGPKNLITFLGVITIIVIATQLMHSTITPALKNQIQNISQKIQNISQGETP